MSAPVDTPLVHCNANVAVCLRARGFFVGPAGAESTFPQTADGAVEVGEPEQAENGEDDRLAQGGNAVGNVGDAATEQRGLGKIE